MAKKPVSVTLEEGNLLWLQTLTARGGARNLSDAIDRLITDARSHHSGTKAAQRSVVGTIDIDASDPTLDAADRAMRTLFETSLRRPFVARERTEKSRTGARPRRRRG